MNSSAALSSGTQLPADVVDAGRRIAIEVSDVTVAYRSYSQRPTSLKETVIRLMRGQRSKTYSMFKALDNVNFRIQQGQVFALLGSNGSGKSTLLKVIAGVLPPSSGHVQRRGEIASLIELGAGFDPELTAIENIFLHGSLHRKTRKQMESRVQAILDFSELHEFAHTPVKYFSSGMFARLGFSVAIDVDPEIMLIDEILGVGDERFQAKCAVLMEQFVAKGKTIVLVTHDMSVIEQRAHAALVLSKGRVVFCGNPHEAVEIYRSGNYETRLK